MKKHLVLWSLAFACLFLGENNQPEKAFAQSYACMGQIPGYDPTETTFGLNCPATPVPSGWTAGYNAATFVNSVGINVHLNGAYYQYANIPYIVALLRGMNIHNVRDGLAALYPPTGPINATMQASLNTLAANGITADLIVNGGGSCGPLYTPAQISNAVAQVTPGAVTEIEGPNELSTSCGDSSWQADNLAATQAIAAAKLAYSNLANITIYGPSLANTNYALMADLTPWETYGNMHSYQGGYYPETNGYGGFSYNCIGSTPWQVGKVYTYGSQEYNYCNTKQASTGRQVAVTESGYSTYPYQPNDIPLDTKALYWPRVLLTHAMMGVPRSKPYELFAEEQSWYGHCGANCQDATLGLLNPDGGQTPVVYALQGLLNILNDPIGATTSCIVPVTISAPNPSTNPVILFGACKASGEYDAVIWQAAPDWGPNSLTYLNPPNETVTVSVATGSPSALWSMARTGLWTATSPPTFPTSLPVSGQLQILTINGPTPTPIPTLMPDPEPTQTPTPTPAPPAPTPTPAATATPTTLTIVQSAFEAYSNNGGVQQTFSWGTAPSYGDYLLDSFTFSYYTSPRSIILAPQSVQPYPNPPTATFANVEGPVINAGVPGGTNYAQAFNSESQEQWAAYVTDQRGEPQNETWLVGGGNWSWQTGYDFRGADSGTPVGAYQVSQGQNGNGSQQIFVNCPNITAPRIGSQVIYFISALQGTGSSDTIYDPPISVSAGVTLDQHGTAQGGQVASYHLTTATTSTSQVVSGMSAEIASNGTYDPWVCSAYVVQHP